MRIDIWSDVVCPWCYIGKRRLETALAETGLQDAELVWHSFQLDPTASDDNTTPLVEKLAKKYGRSVAEATAMMDNVTKTAAAEGLEFDFSIAKAANTLKAHQLLHHALRRGVQEQVKERIMRGYFCEGARVGDVETLVGFAEECGLEPDEVREGLQNDAFMPQVQADLLKARQLDITGVPFFVFDNRLAVSGAQPADVLVRVIRQAQQD
jgi:predicted DsbA family dithiol-disulfide isomerase